MKTKLFILAALFATSQALSIQSMKKQQGDGPSASVPLPNKCDEGKNAGREYMHPVDQDGINPETLWGDRHDGKETKCDKPSWAERTFGSHEHNLTIIKDSKDKKDEEEKKEEEEKAEKKEKKKEEDKEKKEDEEKEEKKEPEDKLAKFLKAHKNS